MTSYGTGKVYKITSSYTDRVYIGSTCGPLSKRLAKHRTDHLSWTRGSYKKCTSYSIVMHYDAAITLIEDCPCETRDQLHRRERFHIENTPKCVNRVIPARATTDAIQCECGSLVHNMRVHQRTDKHESFMAAKQAAAAAVIVV